MKIQSVPTIVDEDPAILQSIDDMFKNKAFMLHQSQGFDQFPMVNAYKKDEDSFLRTVKVVHPDLVPNSANVINIHVLYKTKKDDDGSMKLKPQLLLMEMKMTSKTRSLVMVLRAHLRD